MNTTGIIFWMFPNTKKKNERGEILKKKNHNIT